MQHGRLGGLSSGQVVLSQHVRLLQRMPQAAGDDVMQYGPADADLPTVAAGTAIDRCVLTSKAVQRVQATALTL